MPHLVPEPVRRRYPSAPLLGVITAVFRDDRVLLVKRRTQPNAGLWAMPGGLVELGETLAEAAAREVREETNLAVEDVRFLRCLEIVLRDKDNHVERHFVLAAHAALSPAGLAVAGDDAEAVMWADDEALAGLPLVRNARAVLRDGRAAFGL